MKKYLRALTIAGSDSGGGAGIQADLKTFSALGCFGMTAITAITAQNTRGVQAVFPLPCEIVAEQLQAVFTDIGIDVVKIGMLWDSAIIGIVADFLKNHLAIPAILDPVICAKEGSPLLQKEAINSLAELFPLSLLITPNLAETSALLGRSIEKRDEMPQAAADLRAMGANNVLIKGGHLKEGQGSDLFFSQTGEMIWFEKSSLQTRNTHGAGCTYSSAIAAYLAKGFSLKEAIGKAKIFLHEALEAGSSYLIGNGHGPLHHFHAYWRY